MNKKRGFASDNNATVHPAILQAMQKINEGHTIGYGDDIFTERAIKLVKKTFGGAVEPFFVFNGTAANVLSIKAITNSFHSIICAETSHINVDECGAPEKFTGCKLLTVQTENGKLTPENIAYHMHGFGFEHHSQPRVISITQSTELGTVYTPDEIIKITDYAHRNGLFVHVDGARLFNAAASLNTSLKAITADCNIDILSFGGTKNGAMMGEAVVFFNKQFARDFKYYRKQSMQLASKMRFISVQFETLLTDDLWRKNANHANRMALKLADEIEMIPQIEITQPVQSNGVFAIVPPEIIAPLQDEYFFYMWDEHRSEVRWMTSFDTTEKDIEGFVRIVKKFIDEL